MPNNDIGAASGGDGRGDVFAAGGKSRRIRVAFRDCGVQSGRDDTRKHSMGNLQHGGETDMETVKPCKRTTGTYRAHFATREEADKFAADLANTAYHGDVAHLCAKCGYWHLSRPEWLAPEWLAMTTGRIN